MELKKKKKVCKAEPILKVSEMRERSQDTHMITGCNDKCLFRAVPRFYENSEEEGIDIV